MGNEARVEALSVLVHKAYCREYERQKGKQYWTGGDYELLDEDTKEFDRVTVRTILNALEDQDDCETVDTGCERAASEGV